MKILPQSKQSNQRVYNIEFKLDFHTSDKFDLSGSGSQVSDFILDRFKNVLRLVADALTYPLLLPLIFQPAVNPPKASSF